MPTSYAGFHAMATQLLRQRGKAITLRREAPAYFNAVTQDTVPAATVDHATSAVFLAPGASARFRLGTLERQADWRCLIAGQGVPFTLAPNDRVVDGDTVYAVLQVETVAPDGVAILYDALVRA